MKIWQNIILVQLFFTMVQQIKNLNNSILKQTKKRKEKETTGYLFLTEQPTIGCSQCDHILHTNQMIEINTARLYLTLRNHMF